MESSPGRRRDAGRRGGSGEGAERAGAGGRTARAPPGPPARAQKASRSKRCLLRESAPEERVVTKFCVSEGIGMWLSIFKLASKDRNGVSGWRSRNPTRLRKGGGGGGRVRKPHAHTHNHGLPRGRCAVRAAREDAQVLQRVEALVAGPHMRRERVRHQAAQRGRRVGERLERDSARRACGFRAAPPLVGHGGGRLPGEAGVAGERVQGAAAGWVWYG